jgi:putative ATP-binding cassette transporter
MKHPFNRVLLKRLFDVAKPYWTSEEKWKAVGWVTLVIGLLAAVALVNVAISEVARDFTTALEKKDIPHFYNLLVIYAGAFLIGTPIIVSYQYARTKLALAWRLWLLRHLVEKYFLRRAYYRVNNNRDIDNPDERMSQDADSFVNCFVGLSVSCLDAAITVVVFSFVLCKISTVLWLAVIGYSLAGTLFSMWLGSRLVGLNFTQTKLEANYRYSLSDTRRDVESIAFYGGEEKEKGRVVKALVAAMTNLQLVMIWNRNIAFVATGYNFMVALIPAAIIAPLYFHGQIDFGTITQAGIAFGQIYGGLSLVISQFSAISSFAANITRLATFVEELNKPAPTEGSRIETRNANQLALQNVTVLTPETARVLVKDLSLSLKAGDSLLIMGPSGSGKSSLLRALAGLWTEGEGTILRPSLSRMMFMPQRPYVPEGTLKECLLYPRSAGISDNELLEALDTVNLKDLAKRVGGLNQEKSWRDILSLGEQQRLTMARLVLARPAFAVLDEATSALDEDNESLLYGLVKQSGATIVSVGHRPSLIAHHTHVLRLDGTGKWELSETGAR